MTIPLAEVARLLDRVRSAGKAITDQMKLSAGGDKYVYEGSTSTVDLFDELESEYLSFITKYPEAEVDALFEATP